eukprot:5328-Rhodomonas_salina.1
MEQEKRVVVGIECSMRGRCAVKDEEREGGRREGKGGSESETASVKERGREKRERVNEGERERRREGEKERGREKESTWREPAREREGRTE